MSDDVQARLGSLLRGGVPEPPDDISLDDIARRVNRRRTRAWLAPLVTVVLVLAIAGSVFVARGKSPFTSARRNNASGSSVSAIAGYQWRLVTVSHSDHLVAKVSRTAGYALEFGPNDAVLGNDGAEAFSGRYRVAGNLVTVTKIAATAGGSAGPGHTRPNPAADAVLAAMRDLFLPNRQPSSTVSATLSGTRLVMSKNTYLLVFRRQGRVPVRDFASASPTPTATAR